MKMNKFKIISIIFGLISLFSLLWGLKHFYDESVIARASLESTIAVNAATQKAHKELQEVYKTSQNEVTALQIKLGKHDLDYLALHKPVLVERIINRASIKVIDQLKSITGVWNNE